MAAHGETCAADVTNSPGSHANAQQHYANDTRTPAVTQRAREEPETKRYDPDCNNPVDHDAADFCVQRRVAKAAEDALSPDAPQTKWAEFQTYIGGFALAGAVLSLILSSYATIVGNKAAKAAIDTVRMERAWISPDIFETTSTPTAPHLGLKMLPEHTIALRWRNSGNSPALKVKSFVLHERVAPGTPIPHFDFSTENPISAVLGAGGSFGVNHVKFSAAELDLIKSNKLDFYLYSRCDYQTIFPELGWRRSENCGRVRCVGTRFVGGEQEPIIVFEPLGPQNTAT